MVWFVKCDLYCQMKGLKTFAAIKNGPTCHAAEPSPLRTWQLWYWLIFNCYITHLLYFMHRPEWTLTVIICPLKGYKGNYGYKFVPSGNSHMIMSKASDMNSIT